LADVEDAGEKRRAFLGPSIPLLLELLVVLRRAYQHQDAFDVSFVGTTLDKRLSAQRSASEGVEGRRAYATAIDSRPSASSCQDRSLQASSASPVLPYKRTLSTRKPTWLVRSSLGCVWPERRPSAPHLLGLGAHLVSIKEMLSERLLYILTAAITLLNINPNRSSRDFLTQMFHSSNSGASSRASEHAWSPGHVQGK
jgi:hypothetical protein